MKNSALISALSLACSAGAFAQTAAPADEPLAPDRPGFTNGSQTVAPGRIMLESGFTQTRDLDQSGGGITDDFPETLLRFGATPKLELQLGVPNYNVQHGGPRGFGDLSLGAKIKVYERGETVASIAPSVIVPFGRRDFRSNYLLPSVLFGIDTALNKRTGFSANLTLSQTQQSGADNNDTRSEFTIAPAVSVGYDLTPKLGVYLDAYAIAPRRGPSSSVVDGGFTYLLTDNLQLDLEYGRGLSGGAAPKHFYGGGVAVGF